MIEASKLVEVVREKLWNWTGVCFSEIRGMVLMAEWKYPVTFRTWKSSTLTATIVFDGRVEIPSNISHLEVKHSNGDDSVKAKIARGHAEQPESSAMRIPAFCMYQTEIQ